MAKKEAEVHGIRIKETRADRTFNVLNLIFWMIVLFITLYPLWLVLIASVSDPDAVLAGEVLFWPKGFSLMGYEAVFQRVLEGRQVDLVFRQRRADERQRQSQCEENRDDFLHRENLLSFVPFSRGERHGIDSSRRCGRVKSEKNGEPKGSRGRSESPLVAPAGAKSPCHKSAMQ